MDCSPVARLSKISARRATFNGVWPSRSNSSKRASVFPFQHELLGSATAHGTSLLLDRSNQWPTVAWAVDSRKAYVAEFRLQVTSISLVGRDAELSKLRSMVDDMGVRAIVLTGPHNIGKTRLTLQATEQNFVNTIVALDPRSLNASDLLVFESTTTETIVILEDPEPNAAEEFARQAVTRAGIKLLITLPTAEQAPILNFGQDSRIQILELGPLSDVEDS